MKVLNAIDILNIPLNEIWDLKQENYKVIYYDGEEKTNFKSITYNRYIWELYKLYPNTPITIKSSIDTIINTQYYSADIHIRLLETTFKHICNFNNINTFNFKEPLLKSVYNVYNLLFIDYMAKIASYVTTMDSTDLVEIINMKETEKIHNDLKPYPESVENAYKELRKLLFTSSNNNNMFIHAYKSKSINENQANQCIGPRGFVTDIDRTVFKQPITSGFISGLTTLFELAAESRTAAKALNASDKHIATSEFNSRIMQILTMTVTNIYEGDCGSTEYFDFLVQPKSINQLKGKYYLDTTDNTLKCIDGTEIHLENKIIKLRTTFGCVIPNDHQICSTCIGKLSQNFKSNSNLGYTFTSFLMEKASQAILSTKHLTHSVKNNEIFLDANASKFFKINTENLYLSKDIDFSCISIILEAKQVYKLLDVLNLTHTHISLEKLGEIDSVTIVEDKNNKKIEHEINLKYNDRACILTKEFLEYIRTNIVNSDSKGNYIIPLNKYNKEHKIFNMPLKENNVINFVTKLASIINTNYEKITNPYEKLDILYLHVNKQFTINLSILEVLIYATTVYNVTQGNYRLGRNSLYTTTESITNINKNRSISMLFSTQDQENAIFKSNLITFDNFNNVSHPMDIYFDPVGVLNATK